ncbi:MAG: alpha/beta fold hydrolase, partial [Candidatus Binataceae bacterium]
AEAKRMPFFNSAGVRIHYQERGRGEPVVLVHGFGNDHKHWDDTGLMKHLANDYRVIAPDTRGHGHSDKPHTQAHYGVAVMSADIIRLLDHLDIRRALMVGYSQGSCICLELMMRHPARLRAVVLGGFGRNGSISRPGRRVELGAALGEENPETITDEVALRFRRGLEAGGNDLKALAACISAEEDIPEPATIEPIKVPALLLSGSRDQVAGDPHTIAGVFVNGRILLLEGVDHVRAPAEPAFHAAVAAFFAHAPA